MVECGTCRFGPYYLTCPACQRDFEMMLLLGEYRDESGRKLPANVKPSVQNGSPVRSADLSVLPHTRLGTDADGFGKLLQILELARWGECVFDFPCRVQAVIPHALTRASEDTLWIQAFLHAALPPEEENKVGQIAYKISTPSDGPLSTSISLVEAFPDYRRFV